MVNVTARRLLNGSTAALQLKRILNHTAWIISKASTHRTEKPADKRRYFSYNSNFILSRSHNVDFPPLLPSRQHSRSDLISSSKNVKTQIIKNITCSFHHLMTFDKDLLVSSDSSVNTRRNHVRALGWDLLLWREDPKTSGSRWRVRARMRRRETLLVEKGQRWQRWQGINVTLVWWGEDITGPSPRGATKEQDYEYRRPNWGSSGGRRRRRTSLRAGQADKDKNKNRRTFWSAGTFKNIKPEETDDKH